MCTVASRLPVDVDAAESGADLAGMLAGDRPVDLLIADVRMPWLTGLQVATSARTSGMAMPIILVTALPDEQLRGRVLRLGNGVLLAKPFRAAELLGLIRQRLFPARA